MNIMNCSDQEWDDSLNMLTNQDTALGGLYHIDPQNMTYSDIWSNDRRVAFMNMGENIYGPVAGYVEE